MVAQIPNGQRVLLDAGTRPQNPASQLHWYIAEELQYPQIYEPEASKDLVPTLAKDMRSRKSPYPELRMFNRTYQFESQTEGDYESDGELRTRTTWDYWDATHLWNLALEAWSDSTLAVYSTREVQPADFADIQQGYGSSASVGAREAVSTLQALSREVTSLHRPTFGQTALW